MSKNVVVDIDDTLADFWGTVLPRMNAYYGTNVKKSDLKDYYRFTDNFGITHKDFLNFLVNDGCLSDLKPNIFFKELLDVHHVLDRHIIIATSRDYHPEAFDLTKEWLSKNDITYDRLVITGKKKKHDIVNCADYVYDDHINNIKGFIDNNNAKSLYIVDQPWNQNFNSPNVTRISTDGLVL